MVRNSGFPRLTLKNRWKNDYAMVESTGITIGLHPTNKKKLGSGSVSIGFMVDSLAKTMAMLEKNHITSRFEDGKSGKYIHFDDLDGTDLYFVDPKMGIVRYDWTNRLD